MMNHVRRGLAALLLMAMAAPAWPGTDARIGTGGALELRLGPGARSVALGGAVLADARGVEAIFFNPAGLAASDAKAEFTFSHTTWLGDTDINYFGASQNFGDWGVMGLTAKVFSVGEIVRTTEDAPDGTGETFSPTFATLGLTYARRMTDRVNFGGTVYYVAERVLQETASGVAFDFGFQYQTGFGGSSIGLALKNMGPNMKFTGSDFEFAAQVPGSEPGANPRTATNASANFELPTYFQFGGMYPLLGQGAHRASLFAAYQNNSFSRDEYRGGLEWSYRDEVALRAGYGASGDEDDLFGFAYGAGVRVPLGSNKLYVDYAGQLVDEFFDDVQHVTIKFTF